MLPLVPRIAIYLACVDRRFYLVVLPVDLQHQRTRRAVGILRTFSQGIWAVVVTGAICATNPSKAFDGTAKFATMSICARNAVIVEVLPAPCSNRASHDTSPHENYATINPPPSSDGSAALLNKKKTFVTLTESNKKLIGAIVEDICDPTCCGNEGVEHVVVQGWQ